MGEANFYYFTCLNQVKRLSKKDINNASFDGEDEHFRE